MSHLPSNSTDLIRKDGAEEIVGCRDEALRLYEEGFRAIHKAKQMAIRATGSNYAGPDLEARWFMKNIEKGDFEKALETTRLAVDGGCWNYMLDAVGMKTFMDATALKEFREQNEKAPPEVTMDNLMATLDHLSNNRVEIFDRGVISLFTKIDHTFKTNPSFRLDKKLILKGVLGEYSGWNHYRSGYGDEVRDLDRIMHLLDGKQVKDAIADAAAVVGDVKGRPAEIETEYFTFKLRANGNLEIGFKRRDLVVKVNCIIAEHFGPVLGYDRRARKSA